MSKAQKASTEAAKPKKTAKEKAKAVGNFFLGLGETVLGVVVMAAVVAVVIVSAGATLLMGDAIPKAFAGGFVLAADGVDRVISPYGDKNEKAAPPQQYQQQQYGQQQQYQPQKQQYQQLQYGQQYPQQHQQYPQQQYAQQQQYQPQTTARPQDNQESFIKTTAKELWQKAKRNPVKTVLLAATFIVGVAFPPASFLAGIAVVAAGYAIAKSADDVYETRKAQQSYATRPTTPQTSPRQQEYSISKDLTPGKSPVVQQAKTKQQQRQ